MNKEKDFFKTCFNIVASLDVKNESQAIAKEVVLGEVENLQQENKQLKEKLDKYENPEDMTLYSMWCTEKVKDENKQLKDNWNKLKEWASNFYNSEEVGWAGCGMRYTLEKIQELEQGSDSNVKL